MTINSAKKTIPLDGSVDQHLMLSKSLATGGSRLTVSGRWKIANGTYWLQITDSTGASSADVCLRWVCKRYEGLYLVLETAVSVLDRENNAQYVLAELVNRNAIRLLDAEELSKTLPHVQAEIAGRGIWTEEMQKEVLFQDFESVLGNFLPM